MTHIRVSAARLRLLTAVLVAGSLNAGFCATVLRASMPTPVSVASPAAAVSGAVGLRSELSVFDTRAWGTDAARIDPDVLQLALGASQCAARNGVVANPATLTIIDYSKPSTERRLWVLDLKTRKVLYEELVAHGQGSGGNLATRFSNEENSHQTSLGLFVTRDTYVGRNGYSLRLDGLDRGFNDRARERAIVMHGAPYVSNDITKALGRLGRSHGCPAVREAIAQELIDRVKGGSLVFSYYPDENWLTSSRYLSACSR